MKSKFSTKRKSFREDCYLHIANMVNLKGSPSKYTLSEKVITIPDEIYIETSGKGVAVEIGSIVIDEYGYQYSLGIINDEVLCDICDYLTEYIKPL